MAPFINRLSDQLTVEVLDVISTSYKKSDNGNYYFTTADGFQVILKNKGETLVLASGCEANYDLDFLVFANTWNKDRLLSKCYLELSPQGTVIFIESVYIFENCAVDFEHVCGFFGRFVQIVKIFFKALNDFAAS